MSEGKISLSFDQINDGLNGGISIKEEKYLQAAHSSSRGALESTVEKESLQTAHAHHTSGFSLNLKTGSHGDVLERSSSQVLTAGRPSKRLL